MYLFMNINVFATSKGFDALIEQMSKVDDKDLALLKTLLSPFYQVLFPFSFLFLPFLFPSIYAFITSRSLSSFFLIPHPISFPLSLLTAFSASLFRPFCGAVFLRSENLRNKHLQ